VALHPGSVSPLLARSDFGDRTVQHRFIDGAVCDPAIYVRKKAVCRVAELALQLSGPDQTNELVPILLQVEQSIRGLLCEIPPDIIELQPFFVKEIL